MSKTQTISNAILTLFLAATVAATVAHSQEAAAPAAVRDTAWKTGGQIGVNFSQVALSNWSGGGQNTLAIAGLVTMFANMKTDATAWDNGLDVGYGFTKLAEQDFRKSDDKVILISKYGYKATDQLFYSALLDARTQLSDGFNYDKIDSATGNPTIISRFAAPAYVTLGLGLTWKPADYFQVFLAPISNRLILVMDDTLSSAGAFGVDPGKKVNSELGALLNATFKKELMTNVTLSSRLNLFSAYESFDKAVVTWESLLGLKVNDYITASVALDVLYDEKVKITRDDKTVGPSTQVREVLAIGLGYKF